MVARRFGIVVVALVSLASVPASAKLKPGVVATKDNWGAVVGFAPDLANPSFRAGDVLDVSTWKKLEAWVPEGLALLVEKWGLLVPTAAYRPIHPSKGYIDATNAYQGDASILQSGDYVNAPPPQPADLPTPVGNVSAETPSLRRKALAGYTAGLPFPDPQTPEEVAYDMQYAYLGDDGETSFGIYWIDAESGVERQEEWRWRYITRAMHRTDLDPKPSIESFADQDVQYTSLAWAVDPYDKAGATALYFRKDDPRDQQGYLYVPTMRRALRMTFGAPGVPWNQTDLLWEDIRGYSGYVEWMTWKSVTKATVLLPMHAGAPTGRDAVKDLLDLETAPHWNPRLDWEPRPTYVVEAVPRFWTSPYSRVVFYVDAETFYVPLKVGYDKKDRLWKVVLNAFNPSRDPDRLPPPMALSLAIDVLAGHATAMPTYGTAADLGLDRAEFTETNLRRIGR